MHRNNTLTAKLEERDQQISILESKLSKLQKRLRETDAYGPPAWIVKDAVRGGYGLEAMGLIQNNSNNSMWHEVSLRVCECAFGSKIIALPPFLRVPVSHAKSILQRIPHRGMFCGLRSSCYACSMRCG